MDCISSSMRGTALAVAKRALEPFCKARCVDSWSARLTILATRLSLSWPVRYCSRASKAVGVCARNRSALSGAMRGSSSWASLAWAL